MRGTIEARLQALRDRVLGAIARGIVKRIDDSGGVQLVQLQVLADETLSGIERLQEFGFTSVPPEGAEAVVAFVGGNRDHGFVVALGHREHRLKDLEEGETALYDAHDQFVHLQGESSGGGGGGSGSSGGARIYCVGKALRIEVEGNAEIVAQGNVVASAEGDAEVTAAGAMKVVAEGDLEMSGADVTVKASGTLKLSGSSSTEISGDTSIEGKDFLGHTHSGVESGSDDTGNVN